jgi:hypothetical protein
MVEVMEEWLLYFEIGRRSYGGRHFRLRQKVPVKQFRSDLDILHLLPGADPAVQNFLKALEIDGNIILFCVFNTIF